MCTCVLGVDTAPHDMHSVGTLRIYGFSCRLNMCSKLRTACGSSKKNGPYICPGRLAHVRFRVRVRVRAGIILENKRLQRGPFFLLDPL